MSISGIGIAFGAGRAVAGRDAPPARRPAAPARHRQEIGYLCRHRARSRPRGRPAQPALRDRGVPRARSPTSACASIWRRPRSAGSPTSGSDGEVGRVPVDRRSTAMARPSRSRPPMPASTRCSACSTPRPATATSSPAATPTSRRSRASSTSWTATAPAPASSRSCRSASRRISARCGRGRLVISAPTATSVQLAEDAPATVFGFKLVQHQLDAGQFHRHRPGRRAAGDVGRSHRPARMPARPSSSASRCRTGRARSSR